MSFYRIPMEPQIIVYPGDEFPVTYYTHAISFNYKVKGMEFGAESHSE